MSSPSYPIDLSAAVAAPHRLLFPVLALGGVFFAILQTVMVPLLPLLTQQLAASPTTVSWTVTITLLVGAVITPVFGRLADLIGPRRVLIGSLILMTVGSLICALSQTIEPLLLGRAVQGAGSAVIPVSITIFRQLYPPEKLVSAVAWMSSTIGIGATLGLPIAAGIAHFASWQVIFWVTAILGMAEVIAVAAVVPAIGGLAVGRFDAVGAVGLAVWLTSALTAVTQGGQWGWTSPTILTLVAVAIVVAPAWGAHQLQLPSPIVDLRLFIRPTVVGSHFAALVAGFAFYGNSLITTQLLQAPRGTGYGMGLTVLEAGCASIPGGLAMIFFPSLAARITHRFAAPAAMITGAALMVAGYFVHLLQNQSVTWTLFALVIVASGTAVTYASLPVLIVNSVSGGETGAANGVNVLVRTVGQTTCSAVVAAIFAMNMSSFAGQEVPSEQGFHTSFLVATAGAVVLLAISIGLYRQLYKNSNHLEVAGPTIAEDLSAHRPLSP